VVQIGPIIFGLIIAYILPGTVTAYGLRYLSPRIDALWSTLERGQTVIGPLILLGILTLVVGLIVSSFRVVVLEPILYRTGVPRVVVSYDKLFDAERREFFKGMVENVYRYEQFYGNVLLALLFFSALRYLVGNAGIIQSMSDFVAFVAVLCSLITLFFATRRLLRDVGCAMRKISE